METHIVCVCVCLGGRVRGSPGVSRRSNRGGGRPWPPRSPVFLELDPKVSAQGSAFDEPSSPV